MMWNRIRHALAQSWGILSMLIALNVFFSIASPYYFSLYNFVSMLHHAAFMMIMATGMVMVIATGGIDVSIGSNMAFTGMVVANLLVRGFPVPLSILLGLGLGILIGVLNGTFIAKLNLQPLIVTLAMLSIFRGATLVVSSGYAVTGLPEGFLNVFAGKGMIQNSVYIGVGAAVLGAVLLAQTPFGLYARAVGGNEECIYVCGINTRRIKILAYSIQGALAALASLTFMASVDGAEPSAGLSTEWMEAIAASILGGNQLSGGTARIFGMVIGTLILSTIRSGLNIIRVPPAYQQVAIGLVLVAAVIADSLRSRRRPTDTTEGRYA